jgi:hypothetical protein
MPLKSFRQYVEDRDQDSPEGSNLPDGKRRNGLADPDPGELKQPHKPNSKDIDLAKQAVQLIMGRSAKWHRTLYKFLRRCGEKIPDVGHIVDNMSKPKDYDKLFGPQLGKNDVEPDVLSPNSADSSPAYYQK